MVKCCKKKHVLLPLLNALQTVKPEQRVILMAHFDDKTRDAIYETITHVLKSEKVPFAKRLFLKAKLSPYKNELRFLADKKKGAVKKREKLAQIGGGPMSHVLKAAVPLLLNIFS